MDTIIIGLRTTVLKDVVAIDTDPLVNYKNNFKNV